jgi:DNA polymerase elongation subunit (family B)
VCSRRRGIVPETLEPLLERRAVYKRRARSSRGAERLACERRQRALKWVLVTCYGYLGYRNARFGRIEAHESVTALGRAALLRAARMAEEAGFSVVHGMVDCLWLRDAGGLPLAGREGELASLSRAVGRATGVELALEGVYGWIAFPPSRLHPSLAAANRYFGRYLTGRLKVRGLEARRRDAPGVVRRLQADVLGVLARCPDLAAVRAALPEAEAAVRRAVERVRSGRADPSELVVRVVASRERYSGRSPAAAVADALRARGVRLMPGQEARYVWGPEGRPVVADGADGYSPERYEALLLRAGASLLAPFGVGEDALARGLGAGRGGRQARLGEWG